MPPSPKWHMYWPSPSTPPHLFGAVSQSCLKCCLPAMVLILPQIKLNLQLSYCAFFFFFFFWVDTLYIDPVESELPLRFWVNMSRVVSWTETWSLEINCSRLAVTAVETESEMMAWSESLRGRVQSDERVQNQTPEKPDSYNSEQERLKSSLKERPEQ